MDGSLLLWAWYRVVSPAVRLDSVNYYLELCRSPSTGGSLASIIGSAVQMLTVRSTSAVSLTLSNWSQICEELGVDKWILLDCWQLDATLTVPGEANLSLLCRQPCLSGVPVVYHAVQIGGESSAAASSHHLFT